MKVEITCVKIGEITRYIARGISNGVEIYAHENTAKEALKRYEQLAARVPEGKSLAETLSAVLTGS